MLGGSVTGGQCGLCVSNQINIDPQMQICRSVQRTLPLTPQFGYCGNSDSPDGAALHTCKICYENAHHKYMPDFTPAFRLSVCHTRDPRLNGLMSKCVLHVRCTLAVSGSGPTCLSSCVNAAYRCKCAVCIPVKLITSLSTSVFLPRRATLPVSYTHLTLPTKRIV